jgi:hypothetical protein
MYKRKLLPLDDLREERKVLLGMYANAKTNYVKANLYNKIKAVNQDLFTVTKDTKYL